jgi:hypothetical protein
MNEYFSWMNRFISAVASFVALSFLHGEISLATQATFTNLFVIQAQNPVYPIHSS